jgi:hypothetical protein
MDLQDLALEILRDSCGIITEFNRASEPGGSPL